MNWRKKYYYCTDIEHCRRAMDDYAYSESEYEAQGGRCVGTQHQPCNKELSWGKYRFRYELAIVPVVITAAVWAIHANYHLLFPVSFHGIGFSQPFSEVSETNSSLLIPIKRNDTADEIVVKYAVKGISATAGVDFIAESGTLVFHQGVAQVGLSIPIIDDRDYKEGREVLSIQLVNVSGAPEHQVVILDAVLSEEQISKAEALIKQQSLIAADLASYIKKELVLRDLIASQPQNSPTQNEYLNQLSINQGNIARARDAYISGFNALKTIDQDTVFTTMDNWLASLKLRAMAQQYQATLIMKDQYKRYSTNNVLEMDIWLNELLDAVPKNTNENDSADSSFKI